VRDKSLRHGHISTLHLWWARRPLATSRAVVFGSLVPDPDHLECPIEFRDAVVRLLKTNVPIILKHYGKGRKAKHNPDPYQPYEDIPDTPRNRLLAFIAKWSPEWIAFERGENGKQPKPEEMLDARCLAKWETSDPESEQGRAVLKIARELVSVANGGDVPSVLDPFSGGGSIPLEAGRLGCQAIANDYNPVAYLILRATCEFPQKFGNKGARIIEGQLQKTVEVKNVLAHDVEYWAKWILERARERIGHLYPTGKDGKLIVGYLWARTAPCSNPTCRAEIPLLGSLLVCNKKDKRVALTMTIQEKEVTFGIAKDKDIKQTEGTMLHRGNCRCPICKQPTFVKDLRRAGLEGKMRERMVAVITETPNGKEYRPVEANDLEAFDQATRLAQVIERPNESILPEITGNDDDDISNSTGIRVHLYGLKTWGSLFIHRQLLAMQTFVGCLREALIELEKREQDSEYRKAVAAYLSIWIAKLAMFLNNVGRWRSDGEYIDSPFSMQKISMAWDFPEANPFSTATGGAIGQLEWITRVIEHESAIKGTEILPANVYCGDGAGLQLASNSIDVVVTDPPYFDAISFADLSDFFYVWHKRGFGELFPETFPTPLTPKTDEATALKHRHEGDGEKAKHHFTSKLAACFANAKKLCKPNGVVAVMFAHQTTEAWTALINALFEAGLNVSATYPIDTELANRARAIDSSALASSITVICRPREVRAAASFRDVRKEIERIVAESVYRFWTYGFRGADLIVACYGPAVGVFGRYERVERADGTLVGVPELLQLAKESALKAIAGEFQGDALSRLYFVWANLYGISEQAWDDARLVVQIGGDSEDAMEVARRRDLFVVDGATCRLAMLQDRASRRLGDDLSAPLIDQLHHAMLLWKEERRTALVNYLRDHDLLDHSAFWKLAQALFEVLPRTEEDWKLVSALLGERETLRMEARRTAPMAEGTLFEI
jgi:putative DNA methylase